jgi:hypothetical protein
MNPGIRGEEKALIRPISAFSTTMASTQEKTLSTNEYFLLNSSSIRIAANIGAGL